MTVDTFAPPQAAEAPAAAEQGTSRRTLLVAGGVAAALALGGAGYFLLSGGSDSTPLSSGPIVLPHKAKPAVKPVAKPAVKKPVVKVPVTSTVPLGRDPFKALYLQPVTTAATGTGSSPTTVTPPSTSGGSTTPAQPSQPTTTAPKVYKLVLTRVDDNKVAVFSVAGKTMLARVGSVFGPTSEIKLLSLSQSPRGVWTATIQVGDSDPVDAAKGDVLYVR